MQGPERVTPPTSIRFEPMGQARVATSQVLANRFADAVWSVLHLIGAHRWREGYETDVERGWSRYRGSRCSICDSPWEGW